MNKALLPDFSYKVEPAGGKYVKLTTAKDDGSGLETWMLQVKTKEAAQALAEALEANKGEKKKK
jgi:nucleoporin NUP2